MSEYGMTAEEKDEIKSRLAASAAQRKVGHPASCQCQGSGRIPAGTMATGYIPCTALAAPDEGPTPTCPNCAGRCVVQYVQAKQMDLWRCPRCEGSAASAPASPEPEPAPPLGEALAELRRAGRQSHMTTVLHADSAKAQIEADKALSSAAFRYVQAASPEPESDDDADYYQFHRLWTAAVGRPGYDKKAWQSQEAALFDLKTRTKSRAASPEPEGTRAAVWACPKCERRFYAMSADHHRECRPGDCIEDRPASPPSPAPRPNKSPGTSGRAGQVVQAPAGEVESPTAAPGLAVGAPPPSPAPSSPAPKEEP